ncbi:hypothetical protein [Rhizobium sullae]|uniref:Uncharacterized protein n=1 Tax=Rhizobium sullae TaxID=50338 RepID=A0ABY5XS02_RHISU|nr:hypothetical protein [Rhizobium sullae]UWU17011.1 hypothetical protein N2599_29870 [Rhizobium sullae]
MNDTPYYYGSDGTNFGTAVEIMAPALMVRYAAAPVQGVGDYRTYRGTSLSAP